ncbi:MAG TPA: FliH/SctL family protein [Sphingomonas sp.]|nr:FliH/SctL family protein [Sphingomonas sp.]
MSDLASAAQFADAATVPVWTRPTASHFVPAANDAPRFSRWADAEAPGEQSFHHAGASAGIGHDEALIAQGFTEGLAEGRRAAEAELAVERDALVRLALNLETLKPQMPDGLAAMLSTTIRRLVAQIVGEVEIDTNTLADRTRAVAALIAEETAPARLRLNPDDIARLVDANISVEMLPDPNLAPGAILLETGSGWVEDGPQVRLDKLRAALDRLGAPR